MSETVAPGAQVDGRTLASGLWGVYLHATRRRRSQFTALLLLMLVGAVAEMATLGAVMPFLALLANPADAAGSPGVARIAAAFGWSRPSDLVIPATLVFTATIVVAGFVRLVLSWAVNKFVMRFSHDLTVKVYENTLHQPYSYHVESNTSDLIASITKVYVVTFGVILPVVEGFVALILAVCILVVLFLIDSSVAIVSAVLLGGIYLALSKVTRRRLVSNSQVLSRMETERVQVVQEGLGGIRDVLIDGAQHVYASKFARSNLELSDRRTINLVLAASPRYVLETFGVVMIAGLAFALSRSEGGLVGALPVLGALALGSQKLLPLLQRVYQAWAQATGSKQLLIDVLEKLDLTCPPSGPEAAPLDFARQIEFRAVGFAYSNGRTVLESINLVIPRGHHLGIVGSTGSGKSTLIDLLLGLLTPTAGDLLVDGMRLDRKAVVAWQRRVAHVPQSIYLADSTIAENIAFGVALDAIDMERINTIAEKVHIKDFIETLPQGFLTSVGERGTRLSGGQRQRIGIARALYKHADVLVLDEATSALDPATESSVMAAIEGLRADLTVITIAHRQTTLRDCDEIIRIEAGRLMQRGTYAEVIGSATP